MVKGKMELGRKKVYSIALNPIIVKAIDSIAEMLETDRTAVLELGVSKVFIETIVELERQLENSGGVIVGKE